MNRIRDSLFISKAPAVRDLSDDHDFDEVVTLGYCDRFNYGRPEASTTGDEFVFPDGPHDYVAFEAAVEYVLDALERGDRVLVHCQAGVSRSGGVCSAVLAERDDMSLSNALRDVQEARDIVSPAPAIRDSMERYCDDELDHPAVGYNNL